MRTLGVAVLGLFVGLVAGTLLTSAIARPMVGGDGSISAAAGILLGMLMPVMGVVGAVVAVIVDRKSRDAP
jgi:hypothetical protein